MVVGVVELGVVVEVVEYVSAVLDVEGATRDAWTGREARQVQK